MEVAMMNHNGRPLSKKQTVRIMVALTILAWATQTLLHQWGFGAQLGDQAAEAAPEKFVPPADSVSPIGATLEIRTDAVIIGAEVKLRQICRWSDRDKSVFEPIGDLVLARLGPKAPFKSIGLDEIRGLLRDAGVNTAAINFAGSTSCTIARSDVEYDEQNALQQWIDARQGRSQEPETVEAAAQPKQAPATQPREDSPVRTLREALVNDLATRLGITPETLQIDFQPQDQKVLNISTPIFQYAIEPIRAKALGRVAWNVTISGGTEAGNKKVSIMAEARAWQTQLVVAKPLTFRQIIRPEDVVQRKALVDQTSDDPLLAVDQTVGQQAARELKPGTVLTARMIDPVQLVKTGQYVTISLDQGAVRIKTVARAMENGCYGQTIRVKNEATKEVFQVVVTAPQTATMNLAASLASTGTQN
jgi:flagella basal body P-ring formation protein FlgA